MLRDLALSAVMACADRRWSPQIGDPTITGWLTVAAYAFCALLAGLVFCKASHGRERSFWGFVTLAMLFLCVNKQLDLQSLLTAIGRCVSQLQGWYGERRPFQRNFIRLLLVAAGMFTALLLWLMRRHLRRNHLALLGVGVVVAFVAVRAVGFHHFDAFLNSRVASLRYNVVLELAGLVLIAANALVLLRFGNAMPPAGRG